MAVAFRSSSTNGGGFGTTLTVTVPAGTLDDDLMVLNFHLEVLGKTLGGLSAWTLVNQIQESTHAQVHEQFVYVKKAASEPASYTITWDATSQWRSSAIASYSGVDTTIPQDVAGSEATGNSATVTATGITTVTADAMLVMCADSIDGGARASAWTSPLVEEVDVNETYLADGIQAGAGASGNKSATLSASAGWCAQLLALRPAAAGVTVGEMMAAQQQGSRWPFPDRRAVVAY